MSFPAWNHALNPALAGVYSLEARLVSPINAAVPGPVMFRTGATLIGPMETGRLGRVVHLPVIEIHGVIQRAVPEPPEPVAEGIAGVIHWETRPLPALISGGSRRFIHVLKDQREGKQRNFPAPLFTQPFINFIPAGCA